MKRFCLFWLFLFGTGIGLKAQTTHSELVRQLAVPSPSGAAVTVKSHCNVILVQGSVSQKMRGYRVRIYFDNGQDARSEAQAAINKFQEIYENVPTYLDYTAPYFKVTVGNFLTKEEAIKLWGNLLNVFPSSFIVTENIELSEFIDQKAAERTSKKETEAAGDENEAENEEGEKAQEPEETFQ